MQHAFRGMFHKRNYTLSFLDFFRTMSQKCLKKHSTNAIKFSYKITNKIANMQEDSVFYAKKVKKSEEFYEKRDLGRENGGKNEKY